MNNESCVASFDDHRDLYTDFISTKIISVKSSGFNIDKSDLSKNLFDWQKDIVAWAIRKGRCAIFAACGLGKTIMQLEWCQKINDHEKRPVLILAPLSVANQTAREGQKFGYSVNVCRSMADVSNGINITNYEIMDKFDESKFAAIVLDESSILKNMQGKTRTALTQINLSSSELH